MARTLRMRHLALLRREGFTRMVEHRSQHIKIPVPINRSFASERDESRRADFKEQLWQSTADRAERERQQQARFAQMRQVGSDNRQSRVGVFASILLAAGFAYGFGTLSTHPKPREASVLTLEATPPPEHNTSQKNLQAAWVDLKTIVGADNVSTKDDDLNSHSGSVWSSYAQKESDKPFAVVRPSSTEEVSKIVKVCHTRRIPVTAYSGGTSLEGHFAATRGGVCVDFSRMDKLLVLHEEDLDCVVQPSMGWENLNEELGKKGLFFPPDPGPGAMIGGMIGTGCSGTNAYRYGTMRDWVLSVTVVLADGTIMKTRQRPRKTSAGYDLTRLIIGSEGTLGLVTEATLKLTSAPKNTRVAVSSFGSVKQAADCVFSVVRKGIPISAIEILDDVQMKCINEAGYTSKQWKEAPTLFFKFSGTPTAVKESIGLVQKEAKAAGSKTFEFASSEEEATDLWSARKEALWSVMSMKREDSDRVWTTDVAVPISRLPDIVEATKADIAESGLIGAIVGHVGDGNFHAIIVYNESEREKTDAVVHRMVKRAIEMEGTSTGEHGIGMVKRDYLEHEYGKEAVDAMRAIKRAWDPLCLLNCDKIVRSQMPAKGEVQEW